MPVLWSPVWTVPPDLRIFRGRVKGFAVGWHDGSFVQYGQDTIIREIPYGGYRVRFRFSDEFWSPSTKSFKLEGIFDDAYALAPGSSEPIPMGSIEINFNWQPICRGYLLILALPAAGSFFYWQRFNPVYGAWNTNTLPWTQEPPFKRVS